MKRRCLLSLLMVLVLCMGMITPVSAVDAVTTDYDGYSFNQWVNFNGDTRASSFSQVNSRIFMDMGGTGTNGMSLAFESAGDNQYYIWSSFRYNQTYLCVNGKNSAGEYYLGGTTNKSNALKWSLGTDGRLYTTYNSVEYFLWMYSNQIPYNESDGFRLTTDTTNSYAISHKRLSLTPPETPHRHPVCGAECTHEDAHETIEAVAWEGDSSTVPVVPNRGTLAAGDYYLKSDISVSRNISISGTVRICLNGHKLNFTGYGFDVLEHGSLEICDCLGTGSFYSSPIPKSSYYIYEDNTMNIGESAFAALYNINYCPDSGTTLYNHGTLTVYGGSFARGIRNTGCVELYDCIIQENSPNDWPLYNSSTGIATIDGATLVSGDSDGCPNYGTLSIVGDSIIRSDSRYGVDNHGNLKVTNANITGTAAVRNTSLQTGADPVDGVEGVCEVSGGTFQGGILNGGIEDTTLSDGVETTRIIKATLKITGTPSIDKIVLNYPDAFEFDYVGTTPIDLEIQVGENFAVGDVVFTHNHEKVSALNLLNTGYVLKTDEGNRVVLAQGYLCDVNGHDWVAADCDTPKTCNTCGESDGEELGHDWQDADCDTPKTCEICGETEGDVAGHAYSAGLCTVCGNDTVIAILDGTSFTLSGPLKEGTRILASGYDSYGRFCGFKEFIWCENILAAELPAWEEIKLFFLDTDWVPLRKTIPLK